MPEPPRQRSRTAASCTSALPSNRSPRPIVTAPMLISQGSTGTAHSFPQHNRLHVIRQFFCFESRIPTGSSPPPALRPRRVMSLCHGSSPRMIHQPQSDLVTTDESHSIAIRNSSDATAPVKPPVPPTAASPAVPSAGMLLHHTRAFSSGSTWAHLWLRLLSGPVLARVAHRFRAVKII